MTITVALRRSIPTSITVVATSTSISPALIARITDSFSSDGICPWINPTRSPVSTRCSRWYSVVAEAASTLGLSSTSGHTTNAWWPSNLLADQLLSTEVIGQALADEDGRHHGTARGMASSR